MKPQKRYKYDLNGVLVADEKKTHLAGAVELVMPTDTRRGVRKKIMNSANEYIKFLHDRTVEREIVNDRSYRTAFTSK